MDYGQVLQYIIQWIKENHNNEITGNILQDVLIEMLDYVKNNDDAIDVDIQDLQNQIDNLSLAQAPQVFLGTDNPNITPPDNPYFVADFYIKTDTDDAYIYTGAEWYWVNQMPIVNAILREYKINNLGSVSKAAAVSKINNLTVPIVKKPNDNFVITLYESDVHVRTFVLVGIGAQMLGAGQHQITESNLVDLAPNNPTLDQVTTNGNTTNNSIDIGGLTVSDNPKDYAWKGKVIRSVTSAEYLLLETNVDVSEASSTKALSFRISGGGYNTQSGVWIQVAFSLDENNKVSGPSIEKILTNYKGLTEAKYLEKNGKVCVLLKMSFSSLTNIGVRNTGLEINAVNCKITDYSFENSNTNPSWSNVVSLGINYIATEKWTRQNMISSFYSRNIGSGGYALIETDYDTSTNAPHTFIIHGGGYHEARGGVFIQLAFRWGNTGVSGLSSGAKVITNRSDITEFKVFSKGGKLCFLFNYTNSGANSWRYGDLRIESLHENTNITNISYISTNTDPSWSDVSSVGIEYIAFQSWVDENYVKKSEITESGIITVTNDEVEEEVYNGISYIDEDIMIIEIRAVVAEAPTGQSLIALVRKNGSTIATLTIPANSRVSNTATNLNVDEGDIIDFEVTQVGSINPGSKLQFNAKIKKQ